ncbi:MAG: outer membrane protein assembly factor BamA [Alphaproteobacteria bacterium]|nr:outer membrane protein assembly factor BamA [Alphaproteobacteria bacterium]
MRRGSTARAAVAIVIALGAWAASAGIFTLSAIAQQSGATINEIRVVGTKRIDPSTVNSYVQIQPGDTYDSARIDASLKALFNTGLFADVTLRREGDALIIQVVENPIINRIAFEGNRRLDDEILDAEVTLRPRVVYTRTKVQNDVKRLLDIYRRSGRFGATVEPKVIQLPENRVDLVFEIDEGPSTGIRAINFIGNRQFSDGSLRDVIQTDESAFWRFLTSNDTYDPDRLSFDRELLRRFYLSEGHADFRVVSAIAELTEDREDFVITFTVEEGPEYSFGKVAVTSRLREIEPNELESLIVGVEGEQYNADEVEETVQSLTANLGARGFAFVDVRPRVNRDRDQRTLDVTYEISEGPRVFVERIDISGNVRTLDEVIRREFTIAEGDAFNTAKLRATRQRLNNLGFFSRVDITNDPGEAPDRTVINVAVEEQSTGELSIGAGFSSTSGPLGDIAIRERNLLGRGQDLRLGLSLGTEQQRIDLSFTEPYFLDRNLAAGFDVFIRTTDLSDESSFEEDQQGFGLRMGYQLEPKLRHTVRYTLSRQNIDDVEVTASEVVKAQAGSHLTSSVTNEFFLDRLNRRFNPTDGYFGSYSIELAGFGGSEKFVRNLLSSAIYTPLFGSSVIASLTGELGHIFTFDDDTVKLTNRFYLGGSSLRGFDNAGVGPRDLLTDDAIGGHQFYAGTAELTFPFGLPEEFDIRGSVFSDFGSAWGVDDPFPNLTDDTTTRVSLGVGIGWVSPFGPLRIDFASAVLKEDYDKTQLFSFNFGTRF